MNNKKGFTLIELIGIIIILGLLVIIGVPSLLKNLKNSETNEYDVFKNNLYLSAEAYLASNVDNISNFSEVGDKVYIPLALLKEAELIESSLINPNSGKNVSMYELIEVTILEDGTYNYDFKYKYNNGTLVYFNPDTGKRCSAKDYENNLANYDTTNILSDGTKSPTGLKSGCMKWFVFNDDVTSDSLTMMLDHNTTAKVAWNTSNDNTDGMNEIITALENDTNSWHESLTLDSNNYYDNYDYTGYKARIITADEIAKITGADVALEWSSDKSYISNPVIGETISYFYVDGAYGNDPFWQTQVANATNKSKYTWLNNYISVCVSNGCDVEDSSNWGYWTSTPVVNNQIYAFHMGTNFLISAWNIDVASTGIRPVIKVSKKVI